MDSQAKVKWQKLKGLLLNKEAYKPVIDQVDLFDKEDTGISINYKVNGIVVKQLKQEGQVELDQLNQINEQIIDNTGAFYWPAEQILTKYCLENQKMLKDNIIELGAGRSGFCGLALSTLDKHVTITDGNPQIVNQLQQNIQLNDHLNVEVGLLQWGKQAEVKQNTTAVLSDCFFFEKFHDELIETLKCYSNWIGAAPTRGGSLERFINKAKECFEIEKLLYHDMFIVYNK